LARFFVLIALMLAEQAKAIDGDYEIPYTDNYGYVYDPEIGKFIKENNEQGSASSVNSSVAESLTPITHADKGQEQEVVSGTTEGRYYSYLIGGGIVILGIFAFYFWSRRKYNLSS